jgi:hypothetical protein
MTSSTTRAHLVRLFGETNIRDQPVDSGKGPDPATVVFPNTPSLALAVSWKNNCMVRVMVRAEASAPLHPACSSVLNVLWEEPNPREVSREMELIDKKA